MDVLLYGTCCDAFAFCGGIFLMTKLDIEKKLLEASNYGKLISANH